jgi:uncharacterized peroxidase-related enzyme
MARLPIVTYEQADEQTKQTYDAIQSKFGMVPNIFKGMANSPATLAAYLQLDEIISGGSFSPIEQNVVRMTVSQYNGCGYCVAAHTMGLGGLGMDPDVIINMRKGQSEDPKINALITFTNTVLKTKGNVADADLEAFQSAGYSNAHATEITVIIAQKTLSNLFNHINDTDLDLPAAPEI